MDEITDYDSGFPIAVIYLAFKTAFGEVLHTHTHTPF